MAQIGLNEPANDVRVGIIGGGLAGLAAAWQLRTAGAQVDLFEAKRKLGGRAGSFKTADGHEIDYCQHVGMRCCTNLVHFLENTGLIGRWVEQSRLHFYAGDGRHIELAAAPLPAPLHLAGLLQRWPGLHLSDRMRVAWGVLRLMRLPPGVGNSQSMIEWLRAHRQTDRAVEHFWRTILVSALGERLEIVSVEAARKTIVDGFAANRDAYKLLIPDRPLSAMFDAEVGASIERRGVRLHRSCPVGRIERVGDILQIDIGGATKDFDAVVVATPWHAVAQLLPQLPSEPGPRLLQPSPITGIHTWWSQPWLPHRHAILTDRLTQWVFRSHADGGDSDNSSGVYYQMVISGQSDLPAKGDIETALQADLAEIFPAIADSRLLRSRLVSDPRAVFSVDVASHQHRLAVDTLSEDRIWLAGDWIDTGWPATMEGAVRSGYLAAASIAENLMQRRLDVPVPALPQSPLVRWLSLSPRPFGGH